MEASVGFPQVARSPCRLGPARENPIAPPDFFRLPITLPVGIGVEDVGVAVTEVKGRGGVILLVSLDVGFSAGTAERGFVGMDGRGFVFLGCSGAQGTTHSSDSSVSLSVVLAVSTSSISDAPASFRKPRPRGAEFPKARRFPEFPRVNPGVFADPHKGCDVAF